MRLQYLSDLHIEYGNNWVDCIIPDAKYLILAGDIAPAYHQKLPHFYNWCRHNFEMTIHVPGNHEYFGTSIEKGDEKMESLCHKYGIIYSQKGIVKIENAKIITCTLWTDSNLYCSDYRHITNFCTNTRSKLYKDHLEFLERNIDSESIVVTHHAPIVEGAQRIEHVGDRLTGLYCNNLPHLVNKSKVWIYGHTHHVSDIVRTSGSILTTNAIGNKKERLPYAKSAIIEV